MKIASKWQTLLTVISGTFIGALNTSIVNVSIPSLMKFFKAEMHQVEWVITAFMIAFSVTMPIVNWLKERLSYRILFILSMTVFSLGSLLCGVSNTLEMLIFSRIIQAIGGGALGPLSMAIVTDVFEANERGRAFGLWGLGVVIGPAIGPTLGGYLSETYSWRWIFYINIPLGLVAIYLGWKYLHRKKLEVTHKLPFDLNGFVWITSAIISLLYSLAIIAENGVTSLGLTILILSVCFMYAFVLAEKKSPFPIWDLSLFRNKIFVSCILITLTRSIALFGGLFLLPFILQDQMHLSESQSGLVMLPGSLVLALLMPISGTWADRGYTYFLTTLGLILLAVSFIIFAWVDGSTSEWSVVAVLLLRGIGIGLLVTPISRATMSTVKHHQVAMASSIANLAQQVGGSLGIAVLVLIKSVLFGAALHKGQSPLVADVFSMHLCFIAAGVIVFISLIPTRHLKNC